VSWFDAQKGYGHIQPDDGGPEIVVHISAVERAGIENLHEGQKLSYRLERGQGGWVAAVNLHALTGISSPEKPSQSPPAEGSSRPPPPKALPHLPRSETAARTAPSRGWSRVPEPADSPLAGKARDFINSYWDQVSGSGDRLLSYLSSIYSPLVNYYGKPTPREIVLKEKYNFIRRWPMRQTWPSAGAESPMISCNNAAAECEIAGVRDFDAASAERGARSTGTVRYSYKVRFMDGSAQIVAEDSKVVSRQ
jgi:cold shock protein